MSAAKQRPKPWKTFDSGSFMDTLFKITVCVAYDSLVITTLLLPLSIVRIIIISHSDVDRVISTAIYGWSLSGDGVVWLCINISSTVAGSDLYILILALVINDIDWRISLPGPLWYQLHVVLFDCRHPHFQNFDSVISIDMPLG